MVENITYDLHCYTEREVGTSELPLITQLKWMTQSTYRFELHKMQHQLNVILLNFTHTHETISYTNTLITFSTLCVLGDIIFTCRRYIRMLLPW